MKNGELSIRYGLAAIKNVGEAAMEMLIKDRNDNGAFESLDDMANRLDGKVVNKRILENLIKAGALDWTGETRKGMTDRLEKVLSAASSLQKDRASGQGALFGFDELAAPPVSAGADSEEYEEWSKEGRLSDEKELLGFYVTGHPLDKFRGVIDADGYTAFGMLSELDAGDRKQKYKFGGMIKLVEHKVASKSGKAFGVMHLQDFTADVEVVCWGDTYTSAKEAGILEPGKVVRFKSGIQVDDRTEDVRMGFCSELTEVKSTAKKPKGLELTLSVLRHSVSDLEKIKTVLGKHSGKTEVQIRFIGSKGRAAIMRLGDSFQVRNSEKLRSQLSRWIDVD